MTSEELKQLRDTLFELYEKVYNQVSYAATKTKKNKCIRDSRTLLAASGILHMMAVEENEKERINQ